MAVAALLIAAAVAPMGAAQQDASPSFVVALAEDGSARITLTMTHDLESDEERAAFRSLENDSATRADARDRFRSRMASVASDASNVTGREMSVSDPAIDLRTADGGSVGVVELAVSWSNLAAQRDGALVVTEPFASGFEPDRRFTVRGPDGHELASASPSAENTDANVATWRAGADLSGFEAVFAPTEGGDGSGIGAPGFGPATALVALAGAALGLARRR